MTLRPSHAVVLVLASCAQRAPELAGFPCHGHDQCVTGYGCHPGIGTCVALAKTDCSNQGVCPSRIQGGDLCPSPGSVVPCSDDSADCSEGCRACQMDGTWGPCLRPGCVLGEVHSCSACDHDCGAQVSNASAICETEADHSLCDYRVCDDGFVDMDQDRSNGCECELQNGGNEIPCNSIDEDCDGADGAVGNTPEHCGACGNTCRQTPHVLQMRCETTNGSAVCLIAACEPGWRDIDGHQANGCEGECTPSGPELCDSLDNDCDGITDNDEADDCTLYYRDDDSDGDGRADDGKCLCAPRGAYTSPTTGDCDDSDSASHIAANEICDGNDNDCDGATSVSELDNDGDGYVGCSSWHDPQGDDPFILGGEDCDDNPAACGVNCSPAIHSDGCDGAPPFLAWDNDCDGQVDENGAMVFFRDADGDGYVNTNDTTHGCRDPDGDASNGPWWGVSTAHDCDDRAAGCGSDCFPDNLSPDRCDGWNQDCDAAVDEDADLRWYHDHDGDGFTNNQDVVFRCTDPDGPGLAWTATATVHDCDDDPAGCGTDCFPGQLWYHDADGDGFTRNSDTRFSCLDPDGAWPAWVLRPTPNDCDDNILACGAGCYPGNTPDGCEPYNQDCDDELNEDPDRLWQQDLDGDGFTNGSTQQRSCTDPDGSGTVWIAPSTPSDCNDGDDFAFPGATETCNNRDDNCDGVRDDDLGFACACADNGTPSDLELCSDAIDNDCDGAIDEVDCAVWWDSRFTRRKTITVAAARVSGNLSGFPVLVRWLADADMAAHARADGGDIAFVDHSGAEKWSHEIEQYVTSNGRLAAWVRIPQLAAATDTTFWIYYGSAAAADQSAPQSVWDDDYNRVYHFAAGLRDSTGNTSAANEDSGDAIAQIGNGRRFDGHDDFIEVSGSLAKTASALTIGLWFRTDTTDSAHHLVWQGESSGNGSGSDQELHLNFGTIDDSVGGRVGGYLNFFLGDQEVNDTQDVLQIRVPFTDTSAYHYAVAVLSGLNTAPRAWLFLDGAFVGSDSGTKARTGRDQWNEQIRIGRPGSMESHFDGSLDEFRVSTVARSPEWVRTQFSNQSAPSAFITVGAVQAL